MSFLCPIIEKFFCNKILLEQFIVSIIISFLIVYFIFDILLSNNILINNLFNNNTYKLLKNTYNEIKCESLILSLLGVVIYVLISLYIYKFIYNNTSITFNTTLQFLIILTVITIILNMLLSTYFASVKENGILGSLTKRILNKTGPKVFLIDIIFIILMVLLTLLILKYDLNKYLILPVFIIFFIKYLNDMKI